MSRLFPVKRRQSFLLAGEAGFEPAHHGVKVRCLTTWLFPIAFILRMDSSGTFYTSHAA
jgi:hypothetical protein